MFLNNDTVRKMAGPDCHRVVYRGGRTGGVAFSVHSQDGVRAEVVLIDNDCTAIVGREPFVVLYAEGRGPVVRHTHAPLMVTI